MIPKLITPAWTSSLNSRLPYLTTSLTLPPGNLIGHLELNMFKAELLISLPNPLSPHQEICWLFPPNRFRIHHPTSLIQATSSLACIPSGAFWLVSASTLCSSTGYSQQSSKWAFECHVRGFPGGTVVKNPPANAGDMGLSHGWGRSHMPWSS